MKAIFAVNMLDGFAVDNTMPWPRSRVDLQRFKRLTSGHTVVMGGGTWCSDMPKPLPERRNCVLSTTLTDTRCEVYSTVEDLLSAVEDDDVWVIGGAKVLWTLLPYIDTVYFTRFLSTAHADITFDVKKYLENFHLTTEELHIDHTFCTYKRI